MKRVVTCTAGTLAASADWNNIQDRAQGLLSAVATSPNNDLTDLEGADERVHQFATSLADATLRQLGDEDWRDRIVTGRFIRHSANDRVGQSTDYNLDDLTLTSVAETTFRGYLGTSGYSSHAGAGTAVSNGSPPVIGATGATRAYAVVIDAYGTGYVYLYVDPTTGYLYLYNNSGAALYGLLFVKATSDTGKR